jgi:hypothetical protein
MMREAEIIGNGVYRLDNWLIKKEGYTGLFGCH